VNIDISTKLSNYMNEFIQKVIDECGPRIPCSPQEAKSAELIKSELSDTCDEISIEKFTCRPNAFLGYIKIDVLLVFSSFLLFFLLPLNLGAYWIQFSAAISFILNVLAFIILWNEFFNYREFIDPLFKKQESQNVIGKILPSNGEVKRVIIFSGHHDSALRFNLLERLKIGYPIIILSGLGVMLVWLGASLVILLLSLLGFPVFDIFFIFVLILFIIGIIPLIGLFLFVSRGEKANKVPGAVDNLSAVAIVLGLGKYLKDHKEIIPENTEIRLISFGCEEAGLRGAYRYVERHLNDLNKSNAECVNMDAIQSVNHVAFIDFEPSTRTKHSDEVINKLKMAALLVNVQFNEASLGGSGFFSKIFGQITGGTDATAFSKSGVKAASITAMNLKEMLQFYHQSTDTLDKINEGALESVLKICIGYIIKDTK